MTAGYGDRVALADVELEIPTGSLLAVIGPNGSGKSTLLKTIAGLLPPFSGTVEVFGGPARVSAKRIAYVPQAELVDWAFPVTVGDVVMMGRVPLIGLGRSPGRTDREAVAEALETVRMTDRARPPDRRPVGRPAPAGLPRQGARGASPTSTCSTSR